MGAHELGLYCGTFVFMIIFMAVAIKSVKQNEKKAKIFYAIGVILYLIVLIGDQQEASANGKNIVLYWVTYVILAVGTALIMVKKKNK